MCSGVGSGLVHLVPVVGGAEPGGRPPTPRGPSAWANIGPSTMARRARDAHHNEQGEGMTSSGEQRLELNWFNKDQALIPTESGRYGYTWVDPRDPRYCETRTLVLDEYVEGEQASKEDGTVYSERADLEPTTDNLLILGESGDVLEALTRVPELREKYVGKVKCIYIDPPFNTGEVFGESYEDNLEHSIWLTMMRDRLDHLYRLLASDGSIWIHLDNKENHRMRMLLDAAFGPGNFVSEVVWQKADSGRNDSDRINAAHDTILVYRKTSAWEPNRFPRDETDNVRFQSPDADPEPWWDDNPTGPAKSKNRQHPGIYGIQHPVTGEMKYPSPGRGWVFDQATMLAAVSEYADYRLDDAVDATARADWSGLPESKIRTDVRDIVLAEPLEVAKEKAAARYAAGNWPVIVLRGTGGEGGGLGRKSYIPTSGRAVNSWWPNSEADHNRAAKAEIKALFPKGARFETPKPERLLERIIHVATNPGDIVLDCFVGSGTSAAVAHKMGRRWVACELLESNFTRYTKPRLEMVAAGLDPGGVSVRERDTDERRLKPGVVLPEGITSPRDAWSIESALNKASRNMTSPIDLTDVISKAVRADQRSDEPALDADEAKELRRLLGKMSAASVRELNLLPVVKRQVVDQIKTERLPDEVQWLGGGGFQVAHLAPAFFDYDPELGVVTLTESALDPDLLVASVAAHLRFRLTPVDRHFHGVRGAMRLYVTRDPLTPEYVASLVAHLGDGESLTLASTVVLDGAAEALRKARRGSRVVHIPSDLFVSQKGKR